MRSVSTAHTTMSPPTAAKSRRGAPSSLSATGRHVEPSGTIATAAAWRFFTQSASVSGGGGGLLRPLLASPRVSSWACCCLRTRTVRRGRARSGPCDRCYAPAGADTRRRGASVAARAQHSETQIAVELELDGSGSDRSRRRSRSCRTCSTRSRATASSSRRPGGRRHRDRRAPHDRGHRARARRRLRAGARRPRRHRAVGSATVPMDEVLVTVAVDFSGRPAFVWRVQGLEGAGSATSTAS